MRPACAGTAGAGAARTRSRSRRSGEEPVPLLHPGALCTPADRAIRGASSRMRAARCAVRDGGWSFGRHGLDSSNPACEPTPRRRRIQPRVPRQDPSAPGQMPPCVQQHVRDRSPHRPPQRGVSRRPRASCRARFVGMSRSVTHGSDTRGDQPLDSRAVRSSLARECTRDRRSATRRAGARLLIAALFRRARGRSHSEAISERGSGGGTPGFPFPGPSGARGGVTCRAHRVRRAWREGRTKQP